MAFAQRRPRTSENGNILVYILIGIALLGLLTAALRMSGSQSDNIDNEGLALKATEVQRYAAAIQQAVSQMLQNGVSESDLRFASLKADQLNGSTTHYGLFNVTPANNTNQVFHPVGGNAEYKVPPKGIQDTMKAWEFFGETDMPQVGSNAADLIMVLPNVTFEFCKVIDQQLGYKGLDNSTTFPKASSCPYSATDTDRFDGDFKASPNTFTTGIGGDMETFSRLPAMQACIRCGSDYHYYYVLIAR